jgi:NTP pyrophosphatase (non-canonical NTP hydrolase)
MQTLGTTSINEFCLIAALKLQEETGEVADAVLAYHQFQRPGKLTDRDHTAELAQEIGDVVLAATVLAHAHGLDIDNVIQARLDQIRARNHNTATPPTSNTLIDLASTPTTGHQHTQTNHNPGR